MKSIGKVIGQGLDKIKVTETIDGVTRIRYETPTTNQPMPQSTELPVQLTTELPVVSQPVMLLPSVQISTSTSTPSLATPTTQQNTLPSTTITDIAIPTQSPTFAGSGTRETYIYNPYQIRNLLDDKVRYDLTFKDYKKIMKVGDVSDYFRIRNVLKSCNTEDDCMAQLTALY